VAASFLGTSELCRVRLAQLVRLACWDYNPDDNPKQLPGNCTVASFMPVLGYQGAVAADYDRLMKGGFLLEHSYTAEDCAPCAQNSGQCSVDAGEDVLVTGVPVLRWRPRSGGTLQ